jgi:hypothetical protein
VDLGPDTNGGALCCRNHVKELSADPRIDLHVCVVGLAALEPSNRAFVEGTGAAFSFVDFRQNGPVVDAHALHLHPWEKTALAEPDVPARLSELASESKPDAIVIDYLPTSFFARPLLTAGVPLVVITLSNEERFFRQLQEHTSSPDWASSDLAVRRLEAYELWLYHQADAVVAFRPSDLAHHYLGRKARVISPIFPQPGPRWSYGGAKSVFYVGNRGHFPNREAIDWLCGELAPRLSAVDSTIQVRVIGANSDDIPEYASRSNVRLMGYADRPTVMKEMTSCGLFVAPMRIDYGSEIKLQEVLSCATPFMATRAALDGLPPLPAVPVIDLGNPNHCAETVASYLRHPDRLARLSERIEATAEECRSDHRTIWGRLIAEVMDARRNRVLPADPSMA